ncbi:MAG: hypothetical protein RLZZ15_671 [Verrucomicrobiota bacterium]|jgi:outer membrane protein assembly factor BamB
MRLPSIDRGRSPAFAATTSRNFRAMALPLGVVFGVWAVVAAAQDWPEFRGPMGQGHALLVGLPLEGWETNRVAWKEPLPGAGWSSPVVSRGQIFLTTAVAPGEPNPGLRALALDAATGKIQWSTEIYPAGGPPPPSSHGRSSPAASTPIVEGERVYVYFGHHGAACLDRAGKIIWRNERLRFDPVPASGGSPILAGERLIYVADCATAPFVVALDKHTGKTLWKVPRTLPPKMKFSFGTPLLVEAGGRPQIVVPGGGAVTALDPADGREIWRVRYARDSSVGPRPVFAHGLMFVAVGYLRTELLAIRADGRGDVTDTHVAWRVTKGAPLTPALLAVGEELYGVNDAGLATCWEAKTGKVIWQEKIQGAFSASPVAADGRILFLNEEGVTTVVKASREFVVLATNPLGESALASPALADDAIFFRTSGRLWGIRLGR